MVRRLGYSVPSHSDAFIGLSLRGRGDVVRLLRMVPSDRHSVHKVPRLVVVGGTGRIEALVIETSREAPVKKGRCAGLGGSVASGVFLRRI